MKRKVLWSVGLSIVLGLAAQAYAQMLPDEITQYPKWEEFLKAAEVVGQKQLTGDEAVTSPWVLTLKLGDVTHRGLWKNVQGRPKGYIDNWRYEVAAYRMDRLLGLNMVPPTVERRFQGDLGSCQYWIDDTMMLRDRVEKKIKMPSYKVFGWNRATYLQRFFDNLIANDDRSEGNILITKDWRMVLIDHSRSFRTADKLIFTEKHPQGPKLMSELPRAIVERAKALTFESIKGAVGDYLTDGEIKAVLVRRDLVLKEIDRLIKMNGEANTLYEK
jgi:hypothetical protein